ncbi:MAG: Bax inhibitor-1/YccA family protein [Capsulimonadales bacterium]|nr:Bax inhibitor-1/YccA family protein [Capsulimonadales bacterium]
MRTANPTLNEETLNNFARNGYFDRAAGRMTIEGTVNKTAILLLLAVAAAAYTWNLVLTGGAALAMPIAFGGAIGALILAVVTSFKPDAARFTAPLYAVLEGLFLGAFSAIINARFPGIVPQAVALTFGVLAVMLVAYRAGVIRASGKFVMGIVAATGAIAVFYLVLMIGNLFNPMFSSFMWQPSPLSIGISLVVTVVAALNLVLDFDLIEDGVRRGAPKWMEWYGGYGLMVTLVWLYIEILRLLSLLSRRD